MMFIESNLKAYNWLRERKEVKKVFLGGTCNESTWRDDLIKDLDIDYFNPVVDDWTEECYEEELKQREICDYVLYTITPKMTGVYSIAEAVDDSCKQPNKTLFCYLNKENDLSFDKAQIKSMEALRKMIEKNGAKSFTSLKEISDYLNK